MIAQERNDFNWRLLSSALKTVWAQIRTDRSLFFPDLDTNCLFDTVVMINKCSRKSFLKNLIFEKSQQTTKKKHEKLPSMRCKEFFKIIVTLKKKANSSLSMMGQHNALLLVLY